MLTHSKPMKKTTTRNSTCLVTPATGLERSEKYVDLGKFDKKMKFRTNPTNASSTTYKIRMEYFKDVTPREWLLYKNGLTRCLNGQGTTARPAKFALARRL